MSSKIFEIEIASERNHSYSFAPTLEVLRGRWASANVAHLEPGAVLRQVHQAAPIIPGMRVRVDVANRTLTVYDPLKETEEGQKIWARISAIFEQNEEVFGADIKPVDSSRVEFSVDAVKEWLYWMRRAINAGHAIKTPESSEIPTLEEVKKLPGKRQAEPWNITSASKPASERFTDVVETGASA